MKWQSTTSEFVYVCFSKTGVFEHEGVWLNSSLRCTKEPGGCLNRKAGQSGLCVVKRLYICVLFLHFHLYFDLLYTKNWPGLVKDNSFSQRAHCMTCLIWYLFIYCFGTAIYDDDKLTNSSVIVILLNQVSFSVVENKFEEYIDSKCSASGFGCHSPMHAKGNTDQCTLFLCYFSLDVPQLTGSQLRCRLMKHKQGRHQPVMWNQRVKLIPSHKLNSGSYSLSSSKTCMTK